MNIAERSNPEILFLLDACHCTTLERFGKLGTELAADRCAIDEPFCSFVSEHVIKHGYFVPATEQAVDLVDTQQVTSQNAAGHDTAQAMRQVLRGEYEHIARQILVQGRLGSSYFYMVALAGSVAVLIPQKDGKPWKIAAIRAESARNLQQEKACLALNVASFAASRMLRKICQGAKLPLSAPKSDGEEKRDAPPSEPVQKVQVHNSERKEPLEPLPPMDGYECSF